MNTITLSQAEFDALPEYSLSVPTGIYIGKRWKRRGADGWYVAEIVDSGGFPEMQISQIEIKDERVHSLPAIAGKTVKSVTTHNNSGGNTEKVRITFTDGTVLTLTTYHRESYIRVRLEPAPAAIVTARSDWPGE